MHLFLHSRYRQANRGGKYNLTNQSDTDSGRRTTSDTQMQTFTENSPEEIADRKSRHHSFTHPAQHKHDTYAKLNADEPYASVNRANCNSVGSYNEIKSIEKRTSTFRPKEGKNPYASYDSLDYDVPSEIQNKPEEGTNHMTSMDIYNYPDDEEFPPPPSEVQTPKHPQNEIVPTKTEEPSDVPHYTINDDDYAIVQKPRKDLTERDKSNNHVNQSHLSNTHSANTKPPPKMQIIVNEPSAYSPVKNSAQFDSPQKRTPSQFSSDVGYLPHHDCMLADHHCNIPPVPPSPARQNGQLSYHWPLPTWSTCRIMIVYWRIIIVISLLCPLVRQGRMGSSTTCTTDRSRRGVPAASWLYVGGSSL